MISEGARRAGVWLRCGCTAFRALHTAGRCAALNVFLSQEKANAPPAGRTERSVWRKQAGAAVMAGLYSRRRGFRPRAVERPFSAIRQSEWAEPMNAGRKTIPVEPPVSPPLGERGAAARRVPKPPACPECRYGAPPPCTAPGLPAAGCISVQMLLYDSAKYGRISRRVRGCPSVHGAPPPVLPTGADLPLW